MIGHHGAQVRQLLDDILIEVPDVFAGPWLEEALAYTSRVKGAWGPGTPIHSDHPGGSRGHHTATAGNKAFGRWNG